MKFWIKTTNIQASCTKNPCYLQVTGMFMAVWCHLVWVLEPLTVQNIYPDPRKWLCQWLVIPELGSAAAHHHSRSSELPAVTSPVQRWLSALEGFCPQACTPPTEQDRLLVSWFIVSHCLLESCSFCLLSFLEGCGCNKACSLLKG